MIRALRALSRAGSLANTAQQRHMAAQGQSFIDRVKLYGANALLGAFVSTGRFDQAFTGLTVTELGDGSVTAQLHVAEKLTNSYNTLHGGASATIVDIVGTMALLSQDPTKAGVTVELNCSYMSAAKQGDTITAVGTVLKRGSKLGFTQVDIFREDGSKRVT